MKLDRREELAAEYVLGSLSAEERSQARDLESSDPDFASAVSTWEARLGPLAVALPSESPPNDLLSAIERRIDSARAELPSTITLRQSERKWDRLADGVDVSVLWRSEILKRQSVLIRFAPDTHYQSHVHPEDEECLVIEGDLQFGELKLGTGDFHFAPRGRTHPPSYSKGGCLLFVTTSL